MAQRVDNEPSRLNVLEDVIKQAAVTGFQHETWRSADYSELTFIFYFSKIPTKVLRISIDLVWKLFEGHIDPGLSKTARSFLSTYTDRLDLPVNQLQKRQEISVKIGQTGLTA